MKNNKSKVWYYIDLDNEICTHKLMYNSFSNLDDREVMMLSHIANTYDQRVFVSVMGFNQCKIENSVLIINLSTSVKIFYSYLFV